MNIRHDLLDSRDGPLPVLMLALTLVTGFVDATSYLRIGHVFVANMTGNVVFLGFAIAGAHGLSIWESLVAVAAFLLGGLIGGRLGGGLGHHRGLLLRAALSAQLVFLAGAAVVAGATGAGAVVATGTSYVLVVLLAVGMGIQNAAVRRLGVRDMTTTVLTMTLTGIAADARVVGGPGSALGRRALSIAAMVLGALVGALLTLRVNDFAPLAAATGLVALTAIAAHLVSRRGGAWTKAG
ncbi:MAG TPA: YoaK family protein [Solirubrobacteraceae bacterium]|nr:YoaK family protein [Solirubrobacteraceae bacterium]